MTREIGKFMQTSDEMIREAREKFNLAIANKDAETIRSLLAPSYHIVTGRSDQFHGQDEEAKRWSQVFESDPTAIYIRTPREIKINECWGIAEELGNWKGSYTLRQAQGGALNKILVNASGVYSAKWQKNKNNEWVLQAEVFTTIEFDESCIPPDPI
jgi:ketosteroid isomerase-like protein